MRQAPSVKRNLVLGVSGYGEGGAQIDYVYISHPETNQSILSYIQKIIVEFGFYSEIEINSPNFGFAIYDEYQNLIFSTSYLHIGKEISKINPGDMASGLMEIDFSIAPGKYFFSFILSDNSNVAAKDTARQLDVRERIGPVSILGRSGYPEFKGVGWLPVRSVRHAVKTGAR